MNLIRVCPAFALLLAGLLFGGPESWAAATVTTYAKLSGTDHSAHGSNRYSVYVKATGQSDDQYQNAYTYRSDNDIVTNPGTLCLGPAGCFDEPENVYSERIMSASNHWSSFDFGNGSVDIKIRINRDTYSDVKILPADAPVSILSMTENEVRLKITEPTENTSTGQFLVEFTGADHAKHPLFIFANPLFDGCPAGEVPTGQNQISDGTNTTIGRPGEVTNISLTMANNTSLCIPGGAYVKGRINGTNTSNMSITGRGILSGIDMRHSRSGWDGHLLSVKGNRGINNRVSGITMTDSPKGFIEIYSQVDIDNVKLLGWHINSDGIYAGANSTISNVFLKVNDDALKLMHSNVHIKRAVIWQQPAGSVIQMAWNNHWNLINASVEKLRLIKVDLNRNIGLHQNAALLSARNLMGGKISDITVRDVIAYDNPYNLLYLQLNDEFVGSYKEAHRQGKNCYSSLDPRTYHDNGSFDCASLDGNGFIQVITLQNISTPNPIIKSLIDEQGDDHYGIEHNWPLEYLNGEDDIRFVKFRNVRIDGKRLVHWESDYPGYTHVSEHLVLKPQQSLSIGEATGIIAY